MVYVPPAGQVGCVPLVPRPRYGWMLDNTGVVVAAALVSSAHCCFAPSIWRRLLMQAFEAFDDRQRKAAAMEGLKVKPWKCPQG
jgi:hypothetical protein